MLSQQAPPRDAGGPLAASGTVRGRITSAASGAPLHRVRVTLNGAVQNTPSAVTDTLGAFEILEVPAGSYTLTATRAGYLTIQYGQRRPREAGRTIHVKAGAEVSGIDMALPRGSVLAGRVTDEAGDPAPGVRVEAGSRFVRAIRPDDKGRFELSGLPPGTYRIVARSLVMDGQWEDPAFLQTLAQTGIRAELSETAVETVTLTAEQER